MKKIIINADNKKDILNTLLKRSTLNYGKYEEKVQKIVGDVKNNGDSALFSYTKEFDGFSLNKDNILVTKDEIKEAYKKVSPELVEILKEAAENIRAFHERQVRNTWIDTKPDGSILGQRMIPVEIAGTYAPGGKAAYPSSVLMNVIPATVAGVKKIILATPPAKDGSISPNTIVAADIAGVDEIYKMGGAQAIAAMAFGTDSVPKVDKITGPGNIFVALAKKNVYGNVGIDSIAGPSEIVVLCDETANPKYVAADLLSQAEHDELASAILVTTDETMADKVKAEIDEFTKVLSRKDIIKASLDNFGFLIVTKDIEEAVSVVNDIASEHLEILTKNPFEVMTKVKNAGAIFLGEYSSEPLGDYFAGPNHILPTNGTSRFFSPLSVDDFVKKTSIISFSKEALSKVHEKIETFAESEGLTAHANSIKVRFDK